jgi:hypothetical protein
MVMMAGRLPILLLYADEAHSFHMGIILSDFSYIIH